MLSWAHSSSQHRNALTYGGWLIIPLVSPRHKNLIKDLFIARPKGSKNKLDIEPAKTEPFNYFPEKTVKPVDNSVDNVPRGAFCQCGHDRELHYGGEKGHCNRMNCSCLEYK